jgi:hypothetical protein
MELPLCRPSIFRWCFRRFRCFTFPRRRSTNSVFDAKGILQALLDERYRKVRDVYPDPRTAQPFSGGA